MLEILIPSLYERKDFRKRLLRTLDRQIVPGQVRYTLDIDSGQISIGEKRQRMLEAATGEYVVFIDDDDWISTDYIALILEAIKEKPDVVGIQIHHLIDGKLHGHTFHSIEYDHWFDEPDKKHPCRRFYYRNPNHINPVKRELALLAGYPQIRFGEDHQYSIKLLPHLNTEVYIKKVIYYYRERTIRRGT